MRVGLSRKVVATLLGATIGVLGMGTWLIDLILGSASNRAPHWLDFGAASSGILAFVLMAVVGVRSARSLTDDKLTCGYKAGGSEVTLVSIREGWIPDPFCVHELRFYSAGSPTGHVWDGQVGTFDLPPPPAAVPVEEREQEPHSAPEQSTHPDSRPRRHWLFAITFVVIAALVAAIIIGLGSGSPTGSALTLAQLHRDVQRSLAIGSANFTLHETFVVDVQVPGLRSTSSHTHGRVDFRTGTEEAVYPDGTGLFVGSTCYAQSPNLRLPSVSTWVRVTRSESGQANGGCAGEPCTDPNEFIGLSYVTGQPQLIGTSTIGGLSLSEYQVNIDATTAKAPSNFGRGGSLFIPIAGGGPTQVPATVWIDRKEQIRRLTYVYPISNLGTETDDFTFQFSVRPPLGPPPPSQVVDISQVPGSGYSANSIPTGC